MTNEQLHTSNKGFLVTNSANVNAVYGPWESVNAAKSFLLERFSKMNDDFQIVSTIPVGTTVGVYDDASKQTVTEYWWSSNNLVLKTFGNIHYELQLYDNLDNLIKEINIRNGYVYYPEYVKPITIDNSTKQVVNIGYIRYSYDNSEFITYNSNIDRLGISTDKATHSLLVEWLDNDGLLITSLTLPVYGLSNITLIFYSYNNSESEAPSISIGSNYQNEDWTPNDYGSTIWSKTRFGITDLNHIEWAVSRERIDGKWGDLTDPIITGRWGIDAITSTVKQSLYYYTDTLVNNALDFFDKSLDYLNTVDDYELKDSYSIDGKIWYKDFTGVTPKQRYCYITQRDKNPDKHSLWYTPALFANFSVDGKDADDVEYIYCVSSTNTLNSSDIQQLRQIESVYSTTSFNPGKKLDFTTSGNWTDDPQGVTQETRYEFCAMRKNSKDELGIINYGTFEDPFIWAAFGEQGPDGPGLEYVYILTTGVTDVPTILYPDKDINGRTVNEDEYLPKSVTNSWSDNPLLVTHAYPVLWMSSRKGSEGKWGEFKTPVIWNQFSHSYEIRLSNDNCSIPASALGVYTADVISKATATKVEVFLGNENVTDLIDILCDKYKKHDISGLWYTDATDLVFDPIYLATFTAIKNGEEVATKTQSLQLNKGTDGYSLICIPNSRIWYGGSDYSTNTFLIKVYKYDSAGVHTELLNTDLEGFSLKQQISNDTNTSETINLTSDSTIRCISNATYNDIYVTLVKDSEIVDYDVIDSVDYSRIKGKDHEGIVLECLDNINIPNSKRNSIEYIQNATKTKLHLYKGISDITNQASFEANAVSLENPLTEIVTVLRDLNDPSIFYLDRELTSDVQIVYSATINIDGEDVVYEATQHVNLSSELVTYELRPNITHLISNEAEGLDLSAVVFNVFTSDSVLPNYTINANIEGTGLTSSVSGSTDVITFNIPTEFINHFKHSDINQYLSFNLEVNGKIEDWETITVSPTPQLNGYNYTIDLSDPYLQIPIDLKDTVLQDFSLNTFTVYLGNEKILGLTNSSSNYPYYTVTNLNSISGIKLEVRGQDWVSYFTNDLQNVEKIVYKITVYEDAKTHYDFYKSLNISFVNLVVYKLISNPTTVVTEAKQAGTFTYTPTVLKVFNGELINVTDLKAENLECRCGDIKFNGPQTLSYNESTTTLIIKLYKKDEQNGDIFYDLDDLAIVRNGVPGTDGLSSEYIYGRLTNPSIGEVSPEDLKKSPYNNINSYKNGSLDFSSGSVEIGAITWTDEPQGVTDIYIQEFISVSKKDGDSWTNFTDPVTYAHFGVQGDDGPGIEYIYVNTNGKLNTEVVKNGEDIVGFNIKNSVNNHKTLVVTGVSNIEDVDEAIPNTWSDNIEEVSSTYPYLYMSYRKKKDGHWGAYALPILWNLYISNLECTIDNTAVIIDNNSTNDTLKQLSSTKFTAIYNDYPIALKKLSISDNQSISAEIDGVIDQYLHISGPEYDNNDDNGETAIYHLIKNEGVDEIPLCTGLVNYTLRYNGITVTKVQSLQVKDFSVGEGYKLLVSPSVVPVIYENNQYTWLDLVINVEAVVVKGVENLKVTFDDSYTLKLDDLTVSPLFTIKGLTVSSITPKVLSLEKNGVKVDVLTISFSTKGADGESKFKSTVFIRTELGKDKEPVKPSGGDYYNPVPKGWSDGIPVFDSSKPLLWSSYCIFSTTDNKTPEWSSPTLMLDTDDFDVAYSILENPPEKPGSHGTNHGAGWTNEPTSDAIWMATSHRLAGGDWSDWIITRIKGEKGDPGGPGLDGESPLIINLTDDTDSIIVNLDTVGNFNESTTIQVYYEGTRLNPGSDFDFTRIIANDLPSSIVFSTNVSDLNFEIKPEFYHENKSIRIPIDISVKYKDKNYTNSIDYQILVLNDLVKREVIPSKNVINLDQGLTLNMPSITYEVHEYNNGLKTIYQHNNLPSDLQVRWEYSANSIVTSTEVPELYVPENTNYIDLFLEKKTSKELIDKERIPVVYNGKDGLDGDNGLDGKSASLRMCGEWLPNEWYYAKQLLNNIYYTDVVIYTSDSSLKFYLAIKDSNGSTFNSSDWLEIPYSEIQLTLELYITDSNGNISGGFVDTNKGLPSDNGDILLWSGGTGTTVSASANNATFSVTRGGVIRAKEGLFEGMYAPKLKVFSKPPLVSSLPFIPIIDDENRCDTIVDFSKLNETSFFNSKSNNQARFTLSYNDGSETCYGGEPVIYLPTGFLLPKLNQDNSTDGAKTLYAISLLQNSYIGEPLKTGANILYYNANDTYGYITENNLELNKHLVKWLLGKMNEKLSDYDVTSSNLIPTLLGNTNFVNLLYQYHRSLFIKALSYVGKTFTFINAPEIKGIRGYIHKGSNSNDDLIVPATLLELLYISNKYYSDGLNIVKEVDPTLFELGHYIINKDWVRYTDYDQDYTNTGMISVQSKLIPISDTVIPGNLKSAYIGWDVVSGPFGGTIKETNPSISFPSVNY